VKKRKKKKAEKPLQFKASQHSNRKKRSRGGELGEKYTLCKGTRRKKKGGRSVKKSLTVVVTGGEGKETFRERGVDAPHSPWKGSRGGVRGKTKKKTNLDQSGKKKASNTCRYVFPPSCFSWPDGGKGSSLLRARWTAARLVNLP